MRRELTSDYARVVASHGTTLSEQPPNRISELALQAGVFGGEFGVSWRGEDGEAVEIVHFGRWNRETGPDFREARVRVNGAARDGDIELDRDVRDWDRHGHSSNPAFRNVVLHLFFESGARRSFTRTVDGGAVTQVRLGGAVAVGRAPARHPGGPLAPDALHALVDAAARHRLHVKCRQFARAAAVHGVESALFFGLARAMGFKENTVPFQLVAQRVGLPRARGADGESLLFGIAGFLDEVDFDSCSDDTRGYLRGLWEAWWKHRDAEHRLVLPRTAWTPTSTRPWNHRHRRLGALAVLTDHVKNLAATSADDPGAAIKSLQEVGHAFWSVHFRLDGAAVRPMRLIGAERARDIAVNVLAPRLEPDQAWRAWEAMAAGPAPGPARRTLTRLACTTATPRLRTVCFQQGLLQIARDFPGHSGDELGGLFDL